MYVIFLQYTHCLKKTLIVSCSLLCESGDRVKVDQSSFSAYLPAVMLLHHCSKYVLCIQNICCLYHKIVLYKIHKLQHTDLEVGIYIDGSFSQYRAKFGPRFVQSLKLL